MTEVDLIPDDYRQALRLRRSAKIFFIAFGAVFLLIILGKGLLNSLVEIEKSATETLEAGKVTIVEQRALLEKLRAQQADLQERLANLDSLRGGSPAERMLEIINRATNQSVWFTNLKFRRITEDMPMPLTNNSTAHFRRGQHDEDRQHNNWQGRMHMEISGQALNHSELADLVKRLLDQQEIQDVHIVNTSTLHYPAGQVIAYNLVVIINSREQRQ